MSLRVGIVGLPNAGKSTLFNALVKKNLAKVADYPFTTIKPQEAVVMVPDERLDNLAKIVKPEKVTPATIIFVDIAGLVKGAHKGEGLGNEFLSHIREVDALLLVVRNFQNPNISHPVGSIDPARDIEIIKTELILKDLQIIDWEFDREKDLKKKNIYKKVKEYLNKGKIVRDDFLKDDEKEVIKQINLLSSKPLLILHNISEQDIKQGEGNIVEVCAKTEAELAEFTSKERKEYLCSLGVPESGLTKVIKNTYNLLMLITFYTIKGGKETKAWAISKGSTAIEAAEKVHTDMARGFIKAQVIDVKRLIESGSWQEALTQGKVRFEGRDYIVKDREVIEFKFKV